MNSLFKRPLISLSSLKLTTNPLFSLSKPAIRPISFQMSNDKQLFELPQFDPSLKIDRSSSRYNPIVWVDCEMTGLDVVNDHIIEVACLITDGDLNLVDEGYESVVHYDESVMSAMNEWCIEHHGDSPKSLEQVEEELYQYITKFTDKGKAVLAGNTVHMDRCFLMREFPKVVDHLHYRIIDVSSISEFLRRHNLDLYNKVPKKREAHTAKSDILESIAQLKWYRENYLKGPAE
ncbi:hypothetical protein WICPIJ_003278 [Wickerhamomyces pijperi]|uniref:Exonuclease domain-containing protein n=1 Tax=Wickerhamomyces pijperi TaxID=599730 RepID=A0A9P8TP15_WICPI|nr:hypothetical protein WICPIJ_003278 [Wickerhamomyces pijperi]